MAHFGVYIFGQVHGHSVLCLPLFINGEYMNIEKLLRKLNKQIC